MMPFTPQEYRSDLKPSWCRGCSYFGVLTALTEVFAKRQVPPHRITVVSGIGCSSRITLFLGTFGLHTLHGRAIPVAAGSRLANPEVPVMVVAGDGDLFSIGIGHFAHAAYKNFDMTVLCLNNRMYAMTKNQASPTSIAGYRGSLTPYGKPGASLNVIEFAIACNATFVGRTFAGSLSHMQETIGRAFDHRGFSFVEVIAPCRTFDRSPTPAPFDPVTAGVVRELRHDPNDRTEALKAASHALDHDSMPEKGIEAGVFYQTAAPTFEECIGKNFAPKEEKDPPDSFFDRYAI